MGDMDHVYDYMLRFFLDLICYTLFTLIRNVFRELYIDTLNFDNGR